MDDAQIFIYEVQAHFFKKRPYNFKKILTPAIFLLLFLLQQLTVINTESQNAKKKSCSYYKKIYV
jgi:hypothetical protein